MLSSIVSSKTSGFFSTNCILWKNFGLSSMNFEDINVREILCKGVLTRYAGQMISIAEISGDNADIINQVYSGNWLIKKIVHYWIANSYEHKMTIIKNASGATTKSLMRTKKKNV